MKHDGKRYCVATPVDSVMLLMDRNGNLVDPADEIVERMYNQLDNYFTDRGFEILHTAGFLTVTVRRHLLTDMPLSVKQPMTLGVGVVCRVRPIGPRTRTWMTRRTRTTRTMTTSSCGMRTRGPKSR